MNTVCCLISPVLLFMNSALTYRGAEYVASRSLHSSMVYFGSSNSGSEKLRDMVPWKSSIGEISSKMSDRPEVRAMPCSPVSMACWTRACHRSLPTRPVEDVVVGEGSADRDHPLDRTARPSGDLGRDRHLELHVAQRVAQVLERDRLHVGADRGLGHRLEPLARRLLARGDGGCRPRSRRGTAPCPTCARTGSSPRSRGSCTLSLPNAMHWLAQPHSGWTSSSASGDSVLPALDVLAPDAGVHVALAEPDAQLAAGDPLQPQAEVEVGQEQDLAVRGDRLDDGPARCPTCSSSRTRP